MPVRYILSSVWVRQGTFSHLSVIQYVRLCVFSLLISLVIIERIYIHCLIIIIKSEVWIITHCLRLGHETVVCAVCLSVFLLSDSYVKSTFSTRIFCRGVSGFATDCSCGVWCLGLTTTILYVGPRFGNLSYTTVGLPVWYNTKYFFSLFSIIFIHT